MNIITVNASNIDTEHICCALSEKKGENCVGSKKAWLKDRFEDGFVFKKLDARAKVFIEYIPAERCFAPITAPNYMYVSCFWVSGKYKGHGYANQLLQSCIDDAKAKGKQGLVTLGSKKKMTFLSDPKYLKYKGFEVCDQASPSFELLYLPFNKDSEKPTFNDCMRSGKIENKTLTLYYSNACPHTDKYVKLAENLLVEKNVTYKIVKLTSVEQAQAAPTPCTIYSLFINGEFVTNEILTEKKLMEYLQTYHLV